MTNGTDLVEYEENNHKVLLGDFLENHNLQFDEWLESKGYELFLETMKDTWNNYVEEEYNNTFSYEEDLKKSFSNALNFNVLDNKKTLKKVEDIFKRSEVEK